jgi:hypothetical protein
VHIGKHIFFKISYHFILFVGTEFEW